MAHRSKLPQSVGGMTFIYNVSQHVGYKQTNSPEDVQLVQFLLREIMRSQKAELAPMGFPRPTGQFDAVTGFWVFLWQQFAHRPTVDGIVSPAHGIQYGGGGVWVIVDLNAAYRRSFPQEFEKLHENPELLPSLRAAIQP